MRVRLLTPVLALASLSLLAGANGEGCSGSLPDEGQPVEDDGSQGTSCPEGFVEELACNELEDGCTIVCVPDDSCGDEEPACPPDSYPELVCDGWVEPNMGEPPDQNMDGEPGQGECWTECIPYNQCDETSYPEDICEELPDGQLECWTECVPFDDCGPDSYPQEICEQLEDGEIVCWNECAPIDPCFGEGYPYPFCTYYEDGSGECSDACIPWDYCAPDGQPIETCVDFGDGTVSCYLDCEYASQCPEGEHEEWICADQPVDENGECVMNEPPGLGEEPSCPEPQCELVCVADEQMGEPPPGEQL